VLVLLAAGCSTTPKAIFLHPQFSERIAKIHRVQVVMQSPADIRLMSYYGKTRPETNQSAIVTARLPALIGSQLEQRGFTAITSPVTVTNADAEAQAQAWMAHWQTNWLWMADTNGESALSAKVKLLAGQEPWTPWSLCSVGVKPIRPRAKDAKASLRHLGLSEWSPGRRGIRLMSAE
jgi:hypothetical protein